jgi:uncharacterized protein (TIGR04222 family)
MMNTEHAKLWRSIQDFSFDEADVTFTFARRLARENGWTLSYAYRVIEEYRRFLFLAMTAEHPVTPSEDVDQAWHLHMVYTVSYWKNLCEGVLGRPLHHGPTQGGKAEAAKHDDWYQSTLQSYAKFFGYEAPIEIWQPSEQRFDPNNRFQRINRKDHWVIRRPLWLGKAALWAMLGVLGFTLTGCLAVSFAEIPLFDLKGPEFLKVYLLLVALTFVVAFLKIRHVRDAMNSPFVKPELKDPYALAVLSGGGQLAVIAAIAELSKRRLVGVPRQQEIEPLEEGNSKGLNPFETLVMSKLGTGGKLPELVAKMKDEIERIVGGLEADGWLLTRELWNKARLQVFGFFSVPLIIGLIKLLIGLNRDKPVIYLAILMALTLLLAIIMSASFKRRTLIADRLLKQRRMELARYRSSPATVATAAGDPIPYALPLTIAVFGPAVLLGTPLSPVHQRLGLASTSDGLSSSSGCSSSSSDGGGGSGCGGGGGGGCGGCGGGGGD